MVVWSLVKCNFVSNINRQPIRNLFIVLMTQLYPLTPTSDVTTASTLCSVQCFDNICCLLSL